jgi:CHAT domain-containing protein
MPERGRCWCRTGRFNSQAATELTTKTFAALAAASDIGRAEAFRRSMLTLIAEGRPPGYWAPFIIVGEAGSADR